MDYRNEIKHLISNADRQIIINNLSKIAKLDSHTGPSNTYEIRSLYFDNLYDKALREKIDGVSQRAKFRIRYYNGDTSFIHLEKKSKFNGLGNKLSANLTKEEAQKIVDGDTDWMLNSHQALIVELYAQMKAQGLRPKTIVDYTRIPFVYAPGNVRVTIDFNIRTGLHRTDFLNPDCVMIPAGDAHCILEVKWDEYLPYAIRDAIQLGHKSTAFSKYEICRIYG